MYPTTRMRRLRENQTLRNMVTESEVSLKSLIQPIFIDENLSKKREISSMPGIFRYPLNGVVDEVNSILNSGVKAVLLFGIPSCKDELGSQAYDDQGVIQKSIRLLKENTDVLVIADLCMCEYTSHGHCGLVKDNKILNDETLENYKKIALSYARAGVDIIAPSGMMDGQVHAIRSELDENGYKLLPIMAYSAKFASNLYGPFRDAAESTPGFGDRKSYQMNYANGREALREIELDIEEGADIIMVKPALFYLDIIAKARARFDLPIAAYNVSGEYSMVKAAAKNGWVDEKKVVAEMLTAIRRAGADLIITYYAKEYAMWLKK
ncbi:MAG: porphobilinogen synthase [Thermoplasmata archaeon]